MGSSESNYAGFKLLFEDFYDDLIKKIMQFFPNMNQKEVNDYLVRVINYILRKLHSSIWHKDRSLNDEDIKYHMKI